ncbi:MAG: hypothetical protein ACFFCH_09355 [Promethearchaeota archaeon]
MPSQNLMLQPSSQGSLPLSIWIALLAIFAASGIILRQVAIPIFPPYVTLTPGFVIPLLTGIVLGPLGGILCGMFVGVSGAFWEPVLIPLVGNIALGLSTGLPTYFRHRIHNISWMLTCVISAILIGGFLPTFSIESLVFGVPSFVAALTASVDALQAGIWVIIALILAQTIVDPLVIRHKRKESSVE